MADKRLVEMIMSGEGEGAYLANADLTYAKLQGAILAGADLRSADLLGANLKRANLMAAKLQSANFVDANLMGAYLKGAKFTGANLSGANLNEADLRGANLSGAKLVSADLYAVDFRDADLKGADLRGAYLFRADLRDADLTGADLRGADLENSNLQYANFEGADLSGADLYGANLKGVEFDDQTIWPEGFTPPGGGRMASLDNSTAVPAIGDILVSSWGGNWTIVDFYEVVGISGSMITIQKIGKKVVSDDGRGSQKVMPVPGQYKYKPMKKRFRPTNSGKYGVKIDSSIADNAEAYLWNGKPEYQTAAALGH